VLALTTVLVSQPALQDSEKLVLLGWGELSGSLALDGSAKRPLDLTSLQ
jgi:hypothetical protein